MDRPFLRFNDYLGLSSVLQKNETNQSFGNSSVPDRVTNIQSSVMGKGNLKRIDEIIYFYELKHALKQNMEKNNKLIESQMLVYNNQRNVQDNYKSPSASSGILNNSSHSPNQQAFGIGTYKTAYRSPTNNSNIHFKFDAASIQSLTSTPNMSPCSSNINSPSLLSPFSPTATAPSSGIQNMIKKEENFELASVPKRMRKNTRLQQQFTGCSFCRNNKEVDEWVASHQLKDYLNRVTCPVLRNYKCPLCYASGDNAHTLGHCPLNAQKKNCSLPLAVRRRTNATGRVKL